MKNFLFKITNCNDIIFNISNWYNLYYCNDYILLKITLKFIKNHEKLPLNVIFYMPLSWKQFMENVKLIKTSSCDKSYNY